MLKPTPSLWKLITASDEQSLDSLKARLQFLKEDVDYPRSAEQEIGGAFLMLINDEILFPLAEKNRTQVEAFYKKMVERCFELGYRDGIFVNDENVPVEANDEAHVGDFFYEIMMVALTDSNDATLTELVMATIEEGNSRYAPAQNEVRRHQ